jgi:hypothetical protein
MRRRRRSADFSYQLENTCETGSRPATNNYKTPELESDYHLLLLLSLFYSRTQTPRLNESLAVIAHSRDHVCTCPLGNPSEIRLSRFVPSKIRAHTLASRETLREMEKSEGASS